jgi:hypothetical protein
MNKPELIWFLINPKQAARMLGVKEDTLAIWRCKRRYDLPFTRIGTAIRYDIRDLHAFIERRKVRPKKLK